MQQRSSATMISQAQQRTLHSIHYTLSYRVQGEEHGREGAALLLHGLPGSSFSWRSVMPALAATRAVYAFDLLGYGDSDHPWPADVSIWGQADTLAPCLRQLGLSQIILAGYDVGGGVAQVLATRLLIEQVRALVLISTTCYAQAFAANWPLPEMSKRQEPDAPRHTPLEQLTGDLRATFPKGAARPTTLSAEVLDQYLAHWNTELGKEVLFQHIRQQVPNYSMSVASDMYWIHKPVLIIWGEQDEVLPSTFARRLYRDIPDSRLALIPNTGHLVLEEAPDQVARLMNEFIAGL